MAAIALLAQPFPARAVEATALSGLTAAAPATLPENSDELESAAGQQAGQAVRLISILGSEPFFCCTLGPVTTYVGDYVFDVYRDGTLRGAILFHFGNALLSDPPTGSYLFTATLTPGDIATLRNLIGSARLGVQGNCQGGAPFMRNGSSTRQRMVWYGKVASRTNNFVLFEGDPCPHDVQAIVTLLQAYSPEPIP